MLPGTIFVKFKTAKPYATDDTRIKFKRTPFKDRTESRHTKLGSAATADMFFKTFGKNSTWAQTSITLDEGHHVCFFGHHMSTLFRGLEEHCSDWAISIPDGAYLFYDFSETKDHKKAQSAMQRGKFVSYTELAKKIEIATQHQHQFLLTKINVLANIDERTKKPANGFDTAKEIVHFPPGVTSGQTLIRHIEGYARRMVIPTPLGGLAGTAAGETWSDALSTAIEVVQLAFGS
jgi:hypothetical protein